MVGDDGRRKVRSSMTAMSMQGGSDKGYEGNKRRGKITKKNATDQTKSKKDKKKPVFLTEK